MNSLKQKIILVTGANKGIGYGIVKGLLQNNSSHKIILTSRDNERAEKILNELIEQFPNLKQNLDLHQLDITDEKSIDECLTWVKNTYSQIDILVNNAGATVPGSEFTTRVFDVTFAPNVYGTINLTEKSLNQDLIAKDGKIIIVGSTSGQLKFLEGDKIKNEFKDPDITLQKLYDLADRFRKSIENDTIEQDGWRRMCYSVSKMIINTYPKVLARYQKVIDNNIQVNALCPGWVRTDMGGPKAHLSLEEGIETPLYVIDLEHNPEYQGKFFYQKKIYEFDA